MEHGYSISFHRCARSLHDKPRNDLTKNEDMIVGRKKGYYHYVCFHDIQIIQKP